MYIKKAQSGAGMVMSEHSTGWEAMLQLIG